MVRSEVLTQESQATTAPLVSPANEQGSVCGSQVNRSKRSPSKNHPKKSSSHYNRSKSWRYSWVLVPGSWSLQTPPDGHQKAGARFPPRVEPANLGVSMAMITQVEGIRGKKKKNRTSPATPSDHQHERHHSLSAKWLLGETVCEFTSATCADRMTSSILLFHPRRTTPAAIRNNNPITSRVKAAKFTTEPGLGLHDLLLNFC